MPFVMADGPGGRGLVLAREAMKVASAWLREACGVPSPRSPHHSSSSPPPWARPLSASAIDVEHAIATLAHREQRLQRQARDAVRNAHAVTDMQPLACRPSYP